MRTILHIWNKVGALKDTAYDTDLGMDNKGKSEVLRKRAAQRNAQLLASPVIVTHKGNFKMASLFPADLQSNIQIISMCHPPQDSFCSHSIGSNSA